MNYIPIELLLVSLVWIAAIVLTCKMARREYRLSPRYARISTENRRD